MFSNFLDPENNFEVLSFCQENQCFKWADLGSWVNGNLGTLCDTKRREEILVEKTPGGPGPA